MLNYDSWTLLSVLWAHSDNAAAAVSGSVGLHRFAMASGSDMIRFLIGSSFREMDPNAAPRSTNVPAS